MSIKKFRVFNTNNVWMSLSVLNSIDFNDLDLEIIANVKVGTPDWAHHHALDS